jgi:hypothetical protein
MHDMAYDPVRDEIIVPQFFAFAILTFRGDADGNVAPVRRIFGPRTRLRLPEAVAVDPIHGEIFVPGDDGDNHVLVFSRDADGDVAPIRILEMDTNPNRVAVDPVNNLLIVSGGPSLRIYDRTASGRAQPRAIINVPPSAVRMNTALMAVNPSKGMVFVTVQARGRYDFGDYVAVWSVHDQGDSAPRWTIGGPGGVLRDVRGIALDVAGKNVIVSDKTLNAVLTFNVPEVF